MKRGQFVLDHLELQSIKILRKRTYFSQQKNDSFYLFIFINKNVAKICK